MKNNDRFELYENDEQFTFKKNKKVIEIKFNRVAFIFFVFFIISLIYSIHLIHLGSRNSGNLDTQKSKIYNKLQRADIVDRNGNFLAKTVSSIDIGINPSEIIDQKKLLLNLGIIFPNKDYQLIQSKFNKNKFFWFEKKISDENYEKIMMLGDKSLKPEEKITRVYPQKNLFSHIIGQIDDDNNGISGLEKSLDEQLKKDEVIIKLTVDKEIQFLIREELIKYNEIFKSKGSAAILMNVNNGEILSLVSTPDFNPNLRSNITDVKLSNQIADGLICIAVFHHLSTQEHRIEALKEMKRLVKPGGKILLSVWSIDQPLKTRRKFNDFGNNIVVWNSYGRIFERYYYIFKIDEIKNLFRLVGLSLISHQYSCGNEVFTLVRL